ncbi:hypothetical protein [uncultured Fusobacterium sp.]|uniref:hypothetical protein n=1 Tax=uncultured Fusobacterium sp. TaxID=159267 RepID=UPI0027DB8088|nr:hypothetical protein [uncultured Fusobacterium sp.]
MINVDKLRGKIAEKRTSQAKLAEKLDITPKTFYEKMKRGVFNNLEIEILVKELEIKNPLEIFFTK